MHHLNEGGNDNAWRRRLTASASVEHSGQTYRLRRHPATKGVSRRPGGVDSRQLAFSLIAARRLQVPLRQLAVEERDVVLEAEALLRDLGD